MDSQPQFKNPDQLLEAIQSILALGDPAHWNGHRSVAVELAEQYRSRLSAYINEEDDDVAESICVSPELMWAGQTLIEMLSPPQPTVEEPLPVVEEPINWNCVDAVLWLDEALVWLGEHYGTLAKYEPAQDPDERAVLDRLHGLHSQQDFINHDTIPDNRKAEFWTVWLAIQDHADPDCLIASARRRNLYAAKGWDDPGDFPRVELESSEEFEARIELLQEHGGGKFISAYREVKGRDPVPDDYLSPVEHLEWLRNPFTPIVRQLGPTAEDIEKAHQQIKELVDGGSGASEVQKFINGLQGFNQTGLAKFADQCRAELERARDIGDAIEDLLLRGKPPTLTLSDYFPEDWLPCFRILREGLQFSDDVIIACIVGTLASVMPPKYRVKGWSIEEQILLWVFFIGTSGTAKSVLLKSLSLNPLMLSVQRWVDRVNAQRSDEYNAQLAAYHRNKERWGRLSAKDKEGKEAPKAPEKPGRPVNVIYTAPSSQGIRADLAEHGEVFPGLLVRDELNGWLKEMADPIAGNSDVEFWLSAYDSSFSNEVFADSTRSRKVKCGKVGVIGGIQPKVFLEQLESGNANGFNSRPLFFQLPRLRRHLLKDDQHTKLLAGRLGDLYFNAFHDLRNLVPPTGFLDRLRTFHAEAHFGAKDADVQQIYCHRFWLTPQAEALFEQLFDQLETLSMEAGSEEVEALWAKGPGQVLRAAAAIQMMRNLTGMEDPELEWRPSPETCGRVVADVVASYEEEGSSKQDWVERFVRLQWPAVSARSLELAANLVMAGKVTGVQMHERASNPMLARADRMLEFARKHQGKIPGKGVPLSEIRKRGFSSTNRPSMADLKQVAVLLSSRGLVQLLDNGKSIRVVR